MEIDGRKVPVNTDFRVGISMDSEFRKEQPDGVGLLMVFYKGSIPENIEAATDQMIEFYKGEDEDGRGDQKRKDSAKREYDFTQDADAIFASFQVAYGIDLYTVKMHWWAFHRLMFNLPPDTPFMKRVHYRTADLKKMSKDMRKHYKKMRALYAIKQKDKPMLSVEEREAAFREKMRLKKDGE